MGLALRCLWVALYPARATSDAAIYLELAGKLAAGQPFASGAGIAYWPPGYPVFLAPFVRLFGANAATVIGINLLLFITALWLLHRLAMRLGGRSVARVATLIFALWPNLIASTGIAAKELLVIPLWLACLLVWLDRRAPPIWGASAAGLLLGATILVQPSLQLFPLVLVAHGLWHCGWSRAIARLAYLTLGMALVIGPWSYRNAQRLGRVVPIVTTGGVNLYIGNNPRADGGYQERGEFDLSQLGELERDDTARRLAQQWILQHPEDFALLAIEKQIRFLGEDGTGVYETLKRGGEHAVLTYFVWKAVTTAFWLGLIALLFSVWLRGAPLDEDWMLLVLGVLYLYGLHSVFQSNSKFHEPLSGMLALLAGRSALR